MYKLKIVSIILCLLCYQRTGFVYGKFLAVFSSSAHSVIPLLVHVFVNNLPAGDSSYTSFVRLKSYCVSVHRTGYSCANRVLPSSNFLMEALVALFEVSKRKKKWVHFFPDIALLASSRDRKIY